MVTDIELSENVVSDVKIKQIMEENPDLTYDFIKNILIASEEADAGKLKEYSFDEK